MDKTQSHFLSLLKAAIWQTPLCEADLAGADWKSVMRIAQEQTCDGLICNVASRLEGDVAPPRADMLQWAGRMMAIEQKNALHVATLAEICEMYAKKGLEPILLKGLGVASNYPDPYKRQSGDIDLFTYGKDSYGRVIQMFESEGLNISGHDSDRHSETELNGIRLELHHTACHLLNPFTDNTMQRMIADSERESPCYVNITDGPQVRVFPHGINAVFLLNHMAEHLADTGIGLRQITDWMLFLTKHHDQIDASLLASRLSQLHLTDEWKLFTSLCVDYLDMPMEAATLHDTSYHERAAMLLDLIFACGNFGKNNKRDAASTYWKKKMQGLKLNIQHNMQVMKMAPSLALSNFFFKYTHNALSRLLSGK